MNVDVRDLAAAVRFYTEGLGLHVARRIAAGIVELGGATSAIYLIEQGEGSAATAGDTDGRRYARHWTPVHLDFVVDDFAAALRRAEAAGGVREGEVRELAWGRYAVFADPFGHGFCILQFAGGGYPTVGESGAS